ncbi:phage portal protein [Brachybacterium kimchii]|uniref:Phage portal protein n=1 Tax=Brachybacterium kimchii TaxID=2942909 RepID=A0ABY4N4J0_9MICO|nr:phage portal protein [Brachybacterium kimchii]UQN29473.1 phage portal protein [Brachybacterium kimchii]
MPQRDAWPPEELAEILPAMARWSAWYSGDTAKLSTLYTQDTTQSPFRRQGVFGAVAGAVRRWFWGQTQEETSRPQTKIHVPVASELCQASADLLFGKPPMLTVDDDTTQERLELIMGEGAHNVLAAAAELAAALGGVYLRVAWDQSIAQHPFITRVDADRAIPEFRWGRLVAVTFWATVKRDGGTVWRHLERHETDQDGIGIVRHELYQGTDVALGRVVPLTEANATAGFADVVDADSQVSTLTPGLAVVYVPNQIPNRDWREHPIGANLGRSDLDGVEDLLDQYDEAWSSWMRDLRIGKARIVASQALLDDNGPGQGATLDLDREVYEGVNTPPSAMDSDGGLPIKAVQFDIRVEQHERTVAGLYKQIIAGAGYSAQTFGENSDGGALTATEVRSRESRTYTTRDRKIRAWQEALTALADKSLAIDRAVFRSNVKTDLPVSVQFGNTIQDSQETLARTAQLLSQAMAASVKTRVQMVHPDWSDTEVDEEVARIQEEAGEPAPDPEYLGAFGAGLPTADEPDEEPTGEE